MQRKQQQHRLTPQRHRPFPPSGCQEWGIPAPSSGGVAAAAPRSQVPQQHSSKQAQQLLEQQWGVSSGSCTSLGAPRPWLLERQGEAAASSIAAFEGAMEKAAAPTAGSWTGNPAAASRAKVAAQVSAAAGALPPLDTATTAQRGPPAATAAGRRDALEGAVGWALLSSGEPGNAARINSTRAAAGAATGTHDGAAGAGEDASAVAGSEDASRADAWLDDCISCYEVCVSGLPVSVEDVHKSNEGSETATQENEEVVLQSRKAVSAGAVWSSREKLRKGGEAEEEEKAAGSREYRTSTTSSNSNKSTTGSNRSSGPACGATLARATRGSEYWVAAAVAGEGRAFDSLRNPRIDATQQQNGKQHQHLWPQPEEQKPLPGNAKGGYVSDALSSQDFARQLYGGADAAAAAAAGRWCAPVAGAPVVPGLTAAAAAKERQPLPHFHGSAVAMNGTFREVESEKTGPATAGTAVAAAEGYYYWGGAKAAAGAAAADRGAGETERTEARAPLLRAALKQQLAAALQEQQRECSPSLLQVLQMHDPLQLPPHLRVRPGAEKVSSSIWEVANEAEARDERERLDVELVAGAGAIDAGPARGGSNNVRRKQRGKLQRSPTRAHQRGRQSLNSDVSASYPGGVAAAAYGIFDNAQTDPPETAHEGAPSLAGIAAGDAACVLDAASSATAADAGASMAAAFAAAGRRGEEFRQDLKRQTSNSSDATTCCYSSSVWSSRRSTLRSSESAAPVNQEGRCVSNCCSDAAASRVPPQQQLLLREAAASEETANAGEATLHACASHGQQLSCTEDNRTGLDNDNCGGSNSRNDLTQRQQQQTALVMANDAASLVSHASGAAAATAITADSTGASRSVAAGAGGCADARSAAARENAPPAGDKAEKQQPPRVPDEEGDAQNGEGEAANGRRLLRLLSITLADLEGNNAEVSSQGSSTSNSSTVNSVIGNSRSRSVGSELRQEEFERRRWFPPQQQEQQQERRRADGQTVAQGATTEKTKQEWLANVFEGKTQGSNESITSGELRLESGSDEEIGRRVCVPQQQHMLVDSVGAVPAALKQTSQPYKNEDALEGCWPTAAEASSEVTAFSRSRSDNSSSEERSQSHSRRHNNSSHGGTDARGRIQQRCAAVADLEQYTEDIPARATVESGIRTATAEAAVFSTAPKAASSVSGGGLEAAYMSSGDAMDDGAAPGHRCPSEQPGADAKTSSSSSTNSLLLKLTDVWLPLAPAGQPAPADTQRTPVVSPLYSELYSRSVIFSASRSPAGPRPLTAPTPAAAEAAACREPGASGGWIDGQASSSSVLFERRWTASAGVGDRTVSSAVAAVAAAATRDGRAEQGTGASARATELGRSAFMDFSQRFMLPPAAGGGRLLGGVHGSSCCNMRETGDTCSPKDASTIFVGVRSTLLRVLEDLHTSCCCCSRATAQEHPTVHNPCCSYHFPQRPLPASVADATFPTTAAAPEVRPAPAAPRAAGAAAVDTRDRAPSSGLCSTKEEPAGSAGDGEDIQAATSLQQQQQKRGNEEAKEEPQQQLHPQQKGTREQPQQDEDRPAVADEEDASKRSATETTLDTGLPQIAAGAAGRTSEATALTATAGIRTAAGVASGALPRNSVDSSEEQQALSGRTGPAPVAEAPEGAADAPGEDAATKEAAGAAKATSETSPLDAARPKEEEEASTGCTKEKEGRQELLANNEVAAEGEERRTAGTTAAGTTAATTATAAGKLGKVGETEGEEEGQQDGIILSGDDALLSTRGSSYADDGADTIFAQHSTSHSISSLSAAASFVGVEGETVDDAGAAAAETERPLDNLEVGGEQKKTASAEAASFLRPQPPSLDLLPTPSSFASSSTSPVSSFTSSGSPCCAYDTGAAAAAAGDGSAADAAGEKFAAPPADAPADAADDAASAAAAPASDAAGKYLAFYNFSADGNTKEENAAPLATAQDAARDASSTNPLDSIAISQQQQQGNSQTTTTTPASSSVAGTILSVKATGAGDLLASCITRASGSGAAALGVAAVGSAADAAVASAASVAGPVSTESPVVDVAASVASDAGCSTAETEESSPSRLSQGDDCDAAPVCRSTPGASVSGGHAVQSAAASATPGAPGDEANRETGDAPAVIDMRPTAAAACARASLHDMFYYHADQLRSAHLFVEMLPYVEVFRPCLSAYVLPSLLPAVAQQLLLSELQLLRAEPSRYLSCNAFLWTGKPGAYQCMEDARLMLSSQEYLRPPTLSRKASSKANAAAAASGGGGATSIASAPQTRRQALEAEQHQQRQQALSKESAMGAASGARSPADDASAAGGRQNTAATAAASTCLSGPERAARGDGDVHCKKLEDATAAAPPALAMDGGERTEPELPSSFPSAAGKRDDYTCFGADSEESEGVSMLDPAIFFCVAPTELAAEKASLVRLLRALRRAAPSWGAQQHSGFAYHLLQVLQINSLQSPLLHAYKIVLQQLQAVPPRQWTLDNVLDVLQDLECIKNMDAAHADTSRRQHEQHMAMLHQDQQQQKRAEHQQGKNRELLPDEPQGSGLLFSRRMDTDTQAAERGSVTALLSQETMNRKERYEVPHDAQLQQPSYLQLPGTQASGDSVGPWCSAPGQQEDLAARVAAAEGKRRGGRGGGEAAGTADMNGATAGELEAAVGETGLQDLQPQQETGRHFDGVVPQQAAAARNANCGEGGDEGELALSRVQESSSDGSKQLRTALNYFETGTRGNKSSSGWDPSASGAEFSTSEAAAAANCRRLQELLQLLPPDVFAAAGRKGDASAARAAGGADTVQPPAGKYAALGAMDIDVGIPVRVAACASRAAVRSQPLRTGAAGEASCNSTDSSEGTASSSCNNSSVFSRTARANRSWNETAATRQDFLADDGAACGSAFAVSSGIEIPGAARESYLGGARTDGAEDSRGAGRREMLASAGIAGKDSGVHQLQQSDEASAPVTAVWDRRLCRDAGGADCATAASFNSAAPGGFPQDREPACRVPLPAQVQEEQQSASAEQQQGTGQQCEQTREQQFAKPREQRDGPQLRETDALEEQQQEGQQQNAKDYLSDRGVGPYRALATNLTGGTPARAQQSTGVQSTCEDPTHVRFVQAAAAARGTSPAGGAAGVAGNSPARDLAGRSDSREEADIGAREQSCLLFSEGAGDTIAHAEDERLQQQQQHILRSSDGGALVPASVVAKFEEAAAAAAATGAASEVSCEALLEALQQLLQIHEGEQAKDSNKSVDYSKNGGEPSSEDPQHQQLLTTLLQLAGCCRPEGFTSESAALGFEAVLTACRQQLQQRLHEDSTAVGKQKQLQRRTQQQDGTLAPAAGTTWAEESPAEAARVVAAGAAESTDETLPLSDPTSQPLLLLPPSKRTAAQSLPVGRLSRSCTAPISSLYQTVRVSDAQERPQMPNGPFTRARTSGQLQDLRQQQQEITTGQNGEVRAYLAQERPRGFGNGRVAQARINMFDNLSSSTAAGGSLDATRLAQYPAYRRFCSFEQRGAVAAAAELSAAPPVGGAAVDADLVLARGLVAGGGTAEGAATAAAAASIAQVGAGNAPTDGTAEGPRGRARREAAAAGSRARAANGKGSKSAVIGQRGKTKVARNRRKGSLSPPKELVLRKEYSLRAAELPKIKGVFIGKKSTCWVAQWIDDAGQPRQSCFNIRQHGFDRARSLAIEARRHYMGLSAAARTHASGAARGACSGSGSSKRRRVIPSALPGVSRSSQQLVSAVNAGQQQTQQLLLQQAQARAWTPSTKGSGTAAAEGAAGGGAAARSVVGGTSRPLPEEAGSFQANGTPRLRRGQSLPFGHTYMNGSHESSAAAAAASAALSAAARVHHSDGGGAAVGNLKEILSLQGDTAPGLLWKKRGAGIGVAGAAEAGEARGGGGAATGIGCVGDPGQPSQKYAAQVYEDRSAATVAPSLLRCASTPLPFSAASSRLPYTAQLGAAAGSAATADADALLPGVEAERIAEEGTGDWDAAARRTTAAAGTPWTALQEHHQQLEAAASAGVHRPLQRSSASSSHLLYGRGTATPGLCDRNAAIAAGENAACSMTGATAAEELLLDACGRLGTGSLERQIQVPHAKGSATVGSLGPSTLCKLPPYTSPAQQYIPPLKRSRSDTTSKSNYSSGTLWTEVDENPGSCGSIRKSRCYSSLSLPTDAAGEKSLPHLLQRKRQRDRPQPEDATSSSSDGKAAKGRDAADQQETEQPRVLRRNGSNVEKAAALLRAAEPSYTNKTNAGAATAAVTSFNELAALLGSGAPRGIQHALGNSSSLNSNTSTAGNSEEEEEEASCRQPPTADAEPPGLLAAALLASSGVVPGTGRSPSRSSTESLQQQLQQVEQLQRLLQQHGLLTSRQQEPHDDQQQKAAQTPDSRETAAASSALSALLSCLLESSGSAPAAVAGVLKTTTAAAVPCAAPFPAAAAAGAAADIPGSTSAAIDDLQAAALAAGTPATATTPPASSAACASLLLHRRASSPTNEERSVDIGKDLPDAAAFAAAAETPSSIAEPLVNQSAGTAASYVSAQGDLTQLGQLPKENSGTVLVYNYADGNANPAAPTGPAAATTAGAIGTSAGAGAGDAGFLAPELTSGCEVTSASPPACPSISSSSSVTASSAAGAAGLLRRPWVPPASGPLSLSAALLSAGNQQPQATPTAAAGDGSSFELERSSSLEVSSESESSVKQQATGAQKQGKRSLASLAREFPAVHGISYNVKCACWEAAVPAGATKGRRAAGETAAVAPTAAAAGGDGEAVGGDDDQPSACDTAAAGREPGEDKVGTGVTAGGKEPAQIVKIFSTRKLGGLQEAYETAVLWRERQLAAAAGRTPKGEDNEATDATAAPDSAAAIVSDAASAPALAGEASAAATGVSDVVAVSRGTPHVPDESAVGAADSVPAVGAADGKRQPEPAAS